MRLKKFEIFGFKSFADKTILNFNPGITGIVGPNGCGKSNISDAFRWVLGEQSAKSMRGCKMPDVIFAGTATRKPLNFAEVTLTLGDINGALPTQYDEISVTRRLHRNGESEYFINRQLVRLKDVHSLFLDSGMGKDAYSIFEQGKIDQVINLTPLERRYIFEEAAGILRFLQRKREALRKLELSDQNISRVKDIHLEVEKQIVVLEKQAEKAKVFKENKVKLEVLEKTVFYAKWDNLHKRSTDSSKKEGELKKGIHELNLQLEKLQYNLQEAKDHLREGETAYRARNEEVYKTRSEKEIKSREKLSSQERIKEAIAKEKKWQQELEEMYLKRKKRETECQQAQKQQKSFEAEMHAQEAALKAIREKVHGMEGEVSKLREKQQGYQKELMQLVQSESQTESEFKQNTIRLESNQERKTQMLERKQRLSGQQEDISKAIQEKRASLQEISNGIDEQKNVFNSLETKLNETQKSIQEIQSALDQLHKEHAESLARQKILLKMRDEMEGFTVGSKKLLQTFPEKVKGLYEFITPQPGYEDSIAAVMRPYAHTLVVNTEEDLKQILTYARQNKLKDFSIFCLAHAEEKGLGTLMKKVSPHAIVNHFLNGIEVIKDVDQALEIIQSGQKGAFWMEEGGVLDKQKVLFFTTQGENNVFVREAELKTLSKRIQEDEAKKTKLENKFKELGNLRSKLQQERVEMDKAIRKMEMSLVEVNFALQRYKGDQEKLKNESQHIEKELTSIQEACEKLTELLKSLQNRLNLAKSEVVEKQRLSSSTSGDLERQLGALKQEQRILQEKEAHYHRIADENRKALHALHVIEVKDLESLQQEKRLEEEIQASRELQSHIKVKTGEYEKLLQQVEKLLVEVTSSCLEMEKEVARRKGIIEGINGQIQETGGRLKKLEGDLYQTGIQSAQIESSRQALEEELLERYHLSIEDLCKAGLSIDKPLEQAEKGVRALRAEIEAAGDINMTSIEEFETHKSRYEFLNQQIEDMTVSKKELIQIIQELDTESRKVFQETFEKVRANFQKNFKILFNGGEADLQFTETEDVLEAGIEIIARPPGKQMRSINLLSGGEKCLTAMALLFAIFEVKPAPYCILDEIDAPLDDTNVDRFVNVVKQFIDRCQFIIITHNKRTMSIADLLFGVSMEEKGVSKILSIEFARAEAMSES